jgi:hypothetical protein
MDFYDEFLSSHSTSQAEWLYIFSCSWLFIWYICSIRHIFSLYVEWVTNSLEFSSFLIISFPDESFDKTFHVSVAIDGVTGDRKPVTILHSDRAHNRYRSH